MSQKRSLEISEESVSLKMLKQMEKCEDDKILDSCSLSADLKSSLEYDFVLQTFSVTFEKERKDENRCICLGAADISNIIKLLPLLEKLVFRYSAKRSPKVIDVPFEAGCGEIGDIVTVVSLKENTYKRGQFDVDIRKCIKKEDGFYQYTSEGVRFTHSLIKGVRENLVAYQSVITETTEMTAKVIATTMATAIIREINELADPRRSCHGCQSQHPSQKQHMGDGGCLSTEQPTWEELCTQYWQLAKSLITDDDEIQTRAKKATLRILELQKTFIPGLMSFELIPDDTVKDMVLSKDEADNVPLFKILTEI